MFLAIGVIVCIAVILFSVCVWRRLPPLSEYEKGNVEHEDHVIITHRLNK